jgi:catechol 2,3-dioxygenase-like lactoylglutathione lyase family enzyme
MARLVDGLNHVAFVTTDLDRLAGFYKRVFDADMVVDVRARGVRHAFIELGPSCVLHPFEFPDNPHATASPQIFERGHLDHIAINASSQAAFDTIRQRLVDEGVSDGEITDFGSVFSVFFRDPDGMDAEVCVMKEGASWSDSREPEGWAPPQDR